MTGSEAVTGRDIAAILSRESGKEIVCHDASSEEFYNMFRSMDVPEFVADALVSFYMASAAGEYAGVSGDIEALTGKAPLSMRLYVENFFKKG